jgi:hypothetical protein
MSEKRINILFEKFNQCHFGRLIWQVLRLNPLGPRPCCFPLASSALSCIFPHDQRGRINILVGNMLGWDLLSELRLQRLSSQAGMSFTFHFFYFFLFRQN